MVRFEIQCGAYSATIEAKSPHEAWRTFLMGKDQSKFANLLRFRELPWNAQYAWDKKSGGKSKKGTWYYVQRAWMEGAEAA